MFNPGRLRLARRRRGLTKKGLAERIGVTPHAILRYEIGENEPSEENLKAIAECLRFPIGFFFGTDLYEPQEGAASFRSLTAMSAKDRDAALAAGSLSFLLVDWIEQRFELPDPSLEELSGESPEVAARSLREKWALGEKPIGNMVKLLESKGVRVFSLAENTQTVDAFSLWREDKPYIFLNMMKSAEHGRHDAAHELGHLVLHKHGGPTGRRAEDEANHFASSFLMPAADVLANATAVYRLNQIVEMKKRWSVSVMSLTRRLAKLGVISDWQYRMFCIQATDLGYRTAEPFGIEREQSVIWQMVLTELWKEKITKAKIAEMLDLPVEEIENLLFGLATKVVNPSFQSDKSNRSQLRLI